MDLRRLSEDAPESQWREPLRDKVGAEQLQQVHHCTTQTAGSDGGPEAQRSASSGSRRAADGQQPVSVTTGECPRKPWRIMTADLWHRWPLTWRCSHAFTILKLHAVPCQKASCRSRTEEVAELPRSLPAACPCRS